MTISILKGIHRRALGLDKDNKTIARGGLVLGGEDKPSVVYPGPDQAAVFDDFFGANDGDTGSLPLKVNGAFTIGFSDTGQLRPSTGIAAITNGVFRLTASATGSQDVVVGTQSLNTGAVWKANQGNLRFATRLKTATLAGNTVFAGFTDTGGTELAAYDTGAGILTPAADYAGFIWSGEGGATQQAYRAVAGKAGTDQSATTGVTPTANVYDVLEVEVSGTGDQARFFINGKLVASFNTAAITPTVALGAGVWRSNTDAAADALDIDWMAISANRDTGT